MAQLHPTPHPDFERRDGEDHDTWITRTSALLERLYNVSFSLADDELVNGMIRFSVADGYAHYLVRKAKPLVLQHVPFLDGYAVTPPYIRGLRVADVQELLQRERALHRMFASKK